MTDVNATVRVLDAVGRLQDATDGTEFEPLVDELLEAIEADTTVAELRQEIEFLKTENVDELERYEQARQEDAENLKLASRQLACVIRLALGLGGISAEVIDDALAKVSAE